ncbi:MAG: hypothetical protein H0X17_20750, partial [Deltaproteobacteria bacterium]|nr:hypothetical protein [Deltaproteobacteria bacterium]
MEVVLILGAIGAVVYVIGQRAGKPSSLQLAATTLGRSRHLRSGEFPSSCSWCKNTALARKLFMFERAPEGWRAADVMTQLQTCADADVERHAGVLSSDEPRWRRLCSERCAKELAASEHVAIAEAFGPCEYCSARAPLALQACP